MQGVEEHCRQVLEVRGDYKMDKKWAPGQKVGMGNPVRFCSVHL